MTLFCKEVNLTQNCVCQSSQKTPTENIYVQSQMEHFPVGEHSVWFWDQVMGDLLEKCIKKEPKAYDTDFGVDEEQKLAGALENLIEAIRAMRRQEKIVMEARKHWYAVADSL